MLLRTVGGPHRGFARGTILRRAAAMLRELGMDGAELSVALVDDETMRRLNRQHRGIDRSTDVLAFALSEGDPPGTPIDPMLGDVVISVPTAARQARARRAGLLDELTTLLAHGVLHLVGYDHATKAQERVMFARTAELYAAALPGTRPGTREPRTKRAERAATTRTSRRRGA